jgi:hypothetical protein
MNICVATAQSIVIASTSVPQTASFGSRIVTIAWARRDELTPLHAKRPAATSSRARG